MQVVMQRSIRNFTINDRLEDSNADKVGVCHSEIQYQATNTEHKQL